MQQGWQTSPVSLPAHTMPCWCLSLPATGHRPVCRDTWSLHSPPPCPLSSALPVASRVALGCDGKANIFSLLELALETSDQDLKGHENFKGTWTQLVL